MPNDTPQKSGQPARDDSRGRTIYQTIGITVFTISGAAVGWVGAGLPLLLILFVEIFVVHDHILDRQLFTEPRITFGVYFLTVLGAVTCSTASASRACE